MTDETPSSPAKQHTTIITGDTPVISVQFAEATPADDGRWFRLFNRLVDSGDWARLKNPAARVLVVLARHSSRDGTSLPSQETLEAQSGCSRTQVFAAKKQLESEEHRLIARTSHGAWAMFPAYGQFAGRKPEPITTPAPSQTWPIAGRLSRPWDNASHGRDCQSHRRDNESHGRDVLLRPRQDVDKSETVGGDDENFIALAKAEGIPIREAGKMLDKHGSEDCHNALANAMYLRDNKQLKKSMQAAMWNCLNKGYGLFREVEAHREMQAKKKAQRDLDDRILSICFERHLGERRFAQLSRKYVAPSLIARAALISPEKASAMDDAALANAIYEKSFAGSFQWIPPTQPLTRSPS